VLGLKSSNIVKGLTDLVNTFSCLLSTILLLISKSLGVTLHCIKTRLLLGELIREHSHTVEANLSIIDRVDTTDLITLEVVDLLVNPLLSLSSLFVEFLLKSSKALVTLDLLGDELVELLLLVIELLPGVVKIFRSKTFRRNERRTVERTLLHELGKALGKSDDGILLSRLGRLLTTTIVIKGSTLGTSLSQVGGNLTFVHLGLGLIDPIHHALGTLGILVLTILLLME